MKFARLCLTLALLSASAAIAQDHPALNAAANTVYVGADGKFEAAPDTAQIQFNVSVQDETSQVAFQRASKNVEQVRQGLRTNGINPQASAGGCFSLHPAYENEYTQEVTDYRVR